MVKNDGLKLLSKQRSILTIIGILLLSFFLVMSQELGLAEVKILSFETNLDTRFVILLGLVFGSVLTHFLTRFREARIRADLQRLKDELKELQNK